MGMMVSEVSTLDASVVPCLKAGAEVLVYPQPTPGPSVPTSCSSGSPPAARALSVKRGGAWHNVLADMKVVRVAVNHDMAAANAPLNPDDEVAFFPPVTGG